MRLDERFVRLCVLLVLVAAGVLAPGASARPLIEGGTAAKEGQFPWMAYVTIPGGGFCSGTVVASNVILTAGHCVTSAEPGLYNVVTGAVNKTSGVNSAVAKAIPYPGWELGNHDAAVLVLSRPVAAPAIRLATSPADEKLLAIGAEAFEAGWGKTSFYGGEYPADLMWTNTKTYAVGLTVEGHEEVCAPTTICTSNGGKGVCPGDSGGPLWAETGGGPVEIGLASFDLEPEGGGESTCNRTGSTRVDEIEPWIEEQISAHAPRAVCATDAGTITLSPGLTSTRQSRP